MASLTDSVRKTKTTLKYLGIFIVVLFLFLTFGSSMLKILTPSSYTTFTANNAYGTDLPILDFDKSIPYEKLADATFTPENIKGKVVLSDHYGNLIENTPTVVNVYKYTDYQATLSLREQITAMGAKLGFSTVPTVLGNYYKWLSKDGYQSLEIEQFVRNIEISTDLAKSPTFDGIKVFRPDDFEKYQLDFANYLNSVGVLGSNYSMTLATVPDKTFANASSSNVQNTNYFCNSRFLIYDAPSKTYRVSDYSRYDISASRAELIKGSVFKTVSAYPVTLTGSNDGGINPLFFSNKTLLSKVRTQDPDIGSTTLIQGSSVGQLYFLRSNGYNFDMSNVLAKGYTQGLYNIIDVREAWSKLIDGEATLVKMRRVKAEIEYDPTLIKERVKDFKVKNIYLDYYEPLFVKQEYLQPIYVFQGNAVLEDGESAEFVFYYPAIKR